MNVFRAKIAKGTIDEIGKRFEEAVNAHNFEVIGVLEAKGSDLNGVDQDDQILIPISTALNRSAALGNVIRQLGCDGMSVLCER